MVRALILGAAVGAVLSIAPGCTDLTSFRGSFRGSVVGSDDPSCPPGVSCSFIRRGFPEGTELRLDDFVPPPSDASSIGTVTTVGHDAFDRTPLLRIAPLEHDELSLYTFPGAGRIRNYMFVLRPETGPLAGREAMLFLSLLDNDSVEARIMAGSGDESLGDHFGYFRMERP
jgi:hypothetical protein